MNLRTVWTLNFAVVALSLITVTFGLLQRIDLNKSDKDIIAVYLAGLVGFYLILEVYLFYQTIYKWKKRKRQPYILTTLLVVILSFIVLGRVLLSMERQFTTRLTVISVFCGLNIITYFWGLLKNQEIEY
jgi:hypothetical protein